jgi:outer membrane murein-binding lipoprotein Lpp
MSNDPSDQYETTLTTESFERWLEQQAADQGVSQEELFEQLVSSHWTLNEVIRLLDASEGETQLFEDVAFNRLTSDSDDEAHGDGEITETIDELYDRIDELESQVDTETGRGQSLDQVVEAIATRVMELDDRVGEVASETESVEESLSAECESLAEQIATLEAEFERRGDELAAKDRELSAEQERLQTRLGSEFDHLRTILEYLVARTDELESAISNIESRIDRELSQVYAERDALQALKTEAAEHGADSGACESCNDTIDIEPLERPFCPSCGASLTGIDARDKWLIFSEYAVRTKKGSGGAGRTSEAGRPTPSSGRTDPQQPEPGPGDRTPTGRGPEPGSGSDPTSMPTDGPRTPEEPVDGSGFSFGGSGGASETPATESGMATDADGFTPPADRRGTAEGDEREGTDGEPSELDFPFADGDDEDPDEDDALESPFGNVERLE